MTDFTASRGSDVPKKIHSFEFWSDDGRFGLQLPDSALRQMLQHCRDAAAMETGGILIGHYSDDRRLAVVEQVTGPPEDSRRFLATFLRGVKGLQTLLDRLWRSHRRYYLGEWHYHPRSAPTPSPADLSQMDSIANSDDYACPEPILFILGGDPPERWECWAAVITRQKQRIVLARRLLEATA